MLGLDKCRDLFFSFPSDFLAQVTIVTMGYSHRFLYVCVRCAVVNVSNKTYLLLEFSLDRFEILVKCSI